MDIPKLIANMIVNGVGFAATQKAFEKSSNFSGFLSYQVYYTFKYFFVFFVLAVTAGLIYYYVFKPTQEKFEDKPMFKDSVSTSK